MITKEGLFLAIKTYFNYNETYYTIIQYRAVEANNILYLV